MDHLTQFQGHRDIVGTVIANQAGAENNEDTILDTVSIAHH